MNDGCENGMIYRGVRLKDEPEKKQGRHDILKAVMIVVSAVAVIGTAVYLLLLQLGIR